jgi:hypothetical protein
MSDLNRTERIEAVLFSGRFDHVKIKNARALIEGTQDLNLHTPITRRFYGGCVGELGHYIFDIYGKRHYREELIPWKSWDGPLQPKHAR